MGEARGELKQMEQGERQSEEECRGSQKVREAEGREKEPEACAHLSSHSYRTKVTPPPVCLAL